MNNRINKNKFSNLSLDLQTNLCIIPQRVSVTKNPDDETYEQIVARQEKFLKLNEAVKDKLVSHKTGEKVYNIGKQNNLSLFQIACIARGIRAYYFGEIKLEDFTGYFSREIGIDMNIAQRISEYVTKNIINDSSYIKSSTIQVSLAQALQQYPDAGEQDLTLNPLKLKYFPNSVRPSIKNWVTDYHDNMGAGKHSAIDRGNYLFHSENGKKLTPIERQKLSTILKSLDEKTPISIDPESKKIIFQNNEEPVSGANPGSYGMQSKQKAKNNIETANKGIENPALAELAEDNYFQIPKKETLPKNSTYLPNFGNESESSFLSKRKSESAPQENFKDFSNAGGKLSFSSPHKFPNEQSEEIAKNNTFQKTPQRKTSVMPQTNKAAYASKQPQLQTHWSIKPSSPYQKEPIEDDQISQPKIKGNIVDLREN